jgi:hypothetical protein
MSQRGWGKLSEGVEFTAAGFSAMHLSLVFNALARLKPARDAMRPSNWVALARAVERLVPNLKP